MKQNSVARRIRLSLLPPSYASELAVPGHSGLGRHVQGIMG